MSVVICQEVETTPALLRRRCYGAAVEAALADIASRNTLADLLRAPRLHELLSQIEADGHNTVALRKELELIITAAGTGVPALRATPTLLLRAK